MIATMALRLHIDEARTEDRRAWDAYIDARTDTSVTDSWLWRDLIEQVYGLAHHWYVARQGERIVGVLALTQVRHPVFGSYLATAPFASRGGIYADDPEVFAALLDKAANIRERMRARHVNVRLLNPWPGTDLKQRDGWLAEDVYASFRVPLQPDPEAFLKSHLNSDARNQIRKSIKAGFDVRFGGRELLDDFWNVMIRTMRELGSPYHSRTFLSTLLDTLGRQAELLVVYGGGVPVAGILLLYQGDRVAPLHAGAISRDRHPYAGVHLYWTAISECCRRGYRWFDLGRSLVGSGQEHFKMKWNPVREPLTYLYRLENGRPLPSLNQANPRFQLGIQLWRKLPLAAQTTLGPMLIRGIL